jgi:hypothetical protein
MPVAMRLSTIAWLVNETNPGSGRSACLPVCFLMMRFINAHAGEASVSQAAIRKYIGAQRMEPTPGAKHQTPIPSVQGHTRTRALNL